ncbi:MAG: DUF5652 family protein [archaeon]
MADYFNALASELGVSLWLLTVILIWTAVWKLIALWKSARAGSKIWFVILALVNTVGILEILYIFVFSKMKLYQRTARTKKFTGRKTSKRKK